MEVDAIVNAANSSLMGGGGVDGAIHRAGGPEILNDCRAIVARQGSLATGKAVITSGGRLPAKHVIHTVGPVWNGGQKNEPELLANCYHNSLALAEVHNLHKIAFPNISTGIFGYPKDKAAQVAIGTVQSYLAKSDHPLHVTFVCFDAENYALYQQILKTTA